MLNGKHSIQVLREQRQHRELRTAMERMAEAAPAAIAALTQAEKRVRREAIIETSIFALIALMLALIAWWSR